MDKSKMNELVKKAMSGNKDAFGHIYEQFIDPIYRFVFFRVRNIEDAEDLTQTVFLKVYRALPKFREAPPAFTSWIYTIARNTVIDYWKKKRDVHVEDEDAFFKNIPDNRKSQHDIAIQKDEMVVVTLRLKELSIEQQEVIMLRFYQDLSTEEIATVMDKNEDAVRALQYRALKKLRILLR